MVAPTVLAGGSPVKWVALLVFIVVVFAALWYYGFIEQFLGPWKAWADWIGDFRGEPGVRPQQ
jgi:hypothetical protein